MSVKKLPKYLQTELEKFNVAFMVPTDEREHFDRKFIKAVELRDLERVKELSNRLARTNVNVNSPLFTGYRLVDNRIWYLRLANGNISRYYIGTDGAIVDYLREILYK
jgi:hypothetical protein